MDSAITCSQPIIKHSDDFMKFWLAAVGLLHKSGPLICGGDDDPVSPLTSRPSLSHWSPRRRFPLIRQRLPGCKPNVKELLHLRPTVLDCSARLHLQHPTALLAWDICGKGPILIMAAKTEPRTIDGDQDLVRFLEDILQSTVIKMGQKCDITQEVKPVMRPMTNSNTRATRNDLQDIHRKLLQVMASSSRLEHKLDCCLWMQKFITGLAMVLMVLWAVFLYILYSTRNTATC